MARPVVLSNGQLFVGLDENGLVHDFYYPYVGLENLTNARSSQHKIGVWVDGVFSWTDDGSWQIKVDFEDTALVSKIQMSSPALGVSLDFQDFVDNEYNALVRCVRITNTDAAQREIRLFMHQVFQISRAGRADTALFVPDGDYILDYKGRCCLLVSGRTADNDTFDQYAVGNYRIEGKAGTFKDAEDGELSNNAVEHGGVDSVLRFTQHLEGGEVTTINYWIVAAHSQSDAEAVHMQFKRLDMTERLRHVRQHWQGWLSSDLEAVPHPYKRSMQHSLLIIKAHCDERGSVLASGDSSIFNYGRDYYCYCWPRDAAYAVWPLIRLGLYDEAKRFFEFARDTMHHDGYLMHKYQPDRAIGSTWHPLMHGRSKELAIQEDETATVLFMIGEYFEASQDRTFIENLYHAFINPCAQFMRRYVDEATGLPHASYDLWEEKFLTSTYTVCTVIAALKTAAKLAQIVEQPDDAVKWQRTADTIYQNLDKLYHPDGYFRKGFLLQPDGSLAYDDTLDISSFFGAFMFAGLRLDDERLTSTVRHVEKRLLNTSPTGGVLRYEHDGYFLTKPQYKGNPWIVTTLWLAQYYLATNETVKAQSLIDWALSRELLSGALSEQYDPETATPLSVSPLVWSHAELVNTLLDLKKGKV